MSDERQDKLKALESEISKALLPLVGESPSRKDIYDRVTQITQGIVKRHQLRQIKVICNRNNNPPEVVARNELVCHFVDSITGELINPYTFGPNTPEVKQAWAKFYKKLGATIYREQIRKAQRKL